MCAYSSVGSYSGLGYSQQGSLVSNRATASINQNLNGLYPSYGAGRGFNNFSYGGGLGGYGYGRSALGLGGGFNSTGFLIAAVLIPAITTFISAMFGAGQNESEDQSLCNKCDNDNNYQNQNYDYDYEDSQENFENGFNVNYYGY